MKIGGDVLRVDRLHPRIEIHYVYAERIISNWGFIILVSDHGRHTKLLLLLIEKEMINRRHQHSVSEEILCRIFRCSGQGNKV